MRKKILKQFILVAALGIGSVLCARAAGSTTTNAAPDEVLLLDSLGRVVHVPTNDLPRQLQPRATTGPSQLIPSVPHGQNQPREIQERLAERRPPGGAVEWFPRSQPHLMPYLATQDEYGNNALRPGPLVPTTPLDPVIQHGKEWFSDAGLRYSLQQTATFVSLTNVKEGDSSLGYYTFDFAGKWAIFDTGGDGGTAGWITTQIEAKTGLGPAGDHQSAQKNLGAATNPTGIWSSHNGWRVPELAWQQSLADGHFVVVAGMVSPGNYFDGNNYANSGRGQFINSALIDTMVVPLNGYNPGVILQWQPSDEWYAMLGGNAGGASAGIAPWNEASLNPWTAIGEIGYAPEDVLGLGHGVYRIQPFIAESGGATQGGVGLNIGQKLGKETPFGWFGRFGVGGSAVAGGAKAQVGTGFVMHAPMEAVGLHRKHDNDALGVGFVWTQPSASSKPVIHDNEYVLETTYALQLTPTARLQPDLQVVWDPAFNSKSANAVVFQIQMDLAW